MNIIMSTPSTPISLPQIEREQLIVLFNAGRHAELETRARRLADQYPNCGFIWNVLGASFQMQGKDSLLALQKAAERRVI